MIPAIAVIFAVIIFPWVFTVWMSLNDWRIGMSSEFIGLGNFQMLATNNRFLSTIPRTLYFTFLSVLLPVVLGVFAAEVFHQKFPLRGLLRGIYIAPMMATPVAIALVFTMMFHPQIGVLNYLLSLVGIPKQLWVYSADTVIPTLAFVEVWQWTPLVMLIVLGGLASLPTEPYESAVIDGASQWDMFRYITFPLILPFLMIAVILRTIDALKSFDIIYVISQGGPGTASETINLYLYLQAFSFFQIGHASAVVIVFFVLILALAMILLVARERLRWNR
ncbi:MAG: sugar ABC transporter permease [Chloroflexi bacterium]|nr:sugar ABC transporter permease [Chloroflexota bacterium]